MTYQSDPDISGWYVKDNESEPKRVQAAIEGNSLSLRTLTGREVARWSLDHLENVSIPVLGRDWVIRDRRLQEPLLRLENDQDYAAIQCVASDLAPVPIRTVNQVIFAGNHAGLPVLVLLIAVPAIIWLWQNLPLTYCIATHQNTTLFLKCLIIDHFIP
jgi:hypothetical protein